MDNGNQQTIPPQDPSLEQKSNNNWLRILVIGFGIVSIGISIALAGYILGTKNSQPPVQKVVTQPTPVDETANWKEFKIQSLGVEFKLPPQLTDSWTLKERVLDADPFPGTILCISLALEYVAQFGCDIGQFAVAAYSNDFRVPRGGKEFIEFGGFLEKDGKLYAIAYGYEPFEIPSELVEKITNRYGVSMIKVLGKDRQFEMGTPKWGHIGALVNKSINTNNGKYTGFAIEMKLYQDWNEKTFDQILSTFKFTDPDKTDETASWKIYTDTKGEYTLKYPDTWYTNDCVSPQFDVKQFNDCGSSRTYPITIRDYGNKTVDQIIEEEEEYYEVIEKNVKLSESIYKQVEVSLRKDAPAAPWPYREAVLTLFPYNNKTYVVIFAKDENLDYLGIYNQILSTFRFSN